MSKVVQPVRRTRARSWVLAAVYAAGFVAIYYTAILTPLGQQWDAASLGAFGWLRSEGWLAVYGTRDWIPFVLLAAGGAAGIEGLVRKRWGAVVAAGSLVALTGLASYAFKAGLLPRPHLGDFAYSYQTFPSGHTAISLAAVVAIVWFGPKWLHPVLGVVLGVVVGLVGVASLLSYAHRASDIVGGALLVGVFACGISGVVGVPSLGRAGARVGWTIVGVVGIIVGTIFLAVSMAAMGIDTGRSAAHIDAIGASAIAGLGGVIAVVLANQYPMHARSTD